MYAFLVSDHGCMPSSSLIMDVCLPRLWSCMYAFLVSDHGCMPSSSLIMDVCLLRLWSWMYAFLVSDHGCMPSSSLIMHVCLPRLWSWRLIWLTKPRVWLYSISSDLIHGYIHVHIDRSRLNLKVTHSQSWLSEKDLLCFADTIRHNCDKLHYRESICGRGRWWKIL